MECQLLLDQITLTIKFSVFIALLLACLLIDFFNYNRSILLIEINEI